MKIKYLKVAPRGNPGEIDEVTEFEAKILIKVGLAEAYDEPKKATRKAKTETTEEE